MPLLLLLTGCGLLGHLVDDLTAPEVENPYLGAEQITLDLHCEGDAYAVIERRLGLLDLPYDLDQGPSGNIEVRVTSAVQPEVLARALTAPADLAFLPLAQDQTLVLPRHDRVEEAALDAVSGLHPDAAFDPDAIHALLEGGDLPLPPVEGVRLAEHAERQVFAAPPAADWSAWLGSLPLVSSTVSALSCFTQDQERLCTPVLLEGPASLTAADVVEASLERDPTFGAPSVAVTFGPAGKVTFNELTLRLTGRELGAVSEGRLLGHPCVPTPIPSGRAQITLGLDADSEALQKLWRIYAAVNSGPLPGACTVVE